MSRVVHFEIPAENPERCIKFFQATFGWEITPWGDPNDPYYLVKTGEPNTPGIDGGIMKRKDPAQPVANSIVVESIDAAMEKVKANGGIIVVDKLEIPSVGFMAYFKDTEGNIHGLWEMAAQPA